MMAEDGVSHGEVLEVFTEAVRLFGEYLDLDGRV